MNPRSRVLKLARFGNTSSNCVSLSPNHLPSVAPSWSTEVVGSRLPLPSWSGLLSKLLLFVFFAP